MLALEESNEQKAVANIKKYVEPLTGKILCAVLVCKHPDLGFFNTFLISTCTYAWLLQVHRVSMYA